MPRFPRLTLSAALLSIATLGACSDTPTELTPAAAPSLSRALTRTGEFVILGANGVLPADITASVEAAGGSIIQSYPELGVAVASGGQSGFATRIGAITGVESVTEDRMVDFSDPNMRVVELSGGADEEIVPSETAVNPTNDLFYPIQWALPAINAPEAWNAGYTGQGVRVAILDGGLYDNHQDLRGHVDVAASRSFVAGRAFNTDAGTFWHGTHVAGIVGAADNTVGGVGVAPNATLIGVKVLQNGSGSFTAILNGIMYAATPSAAGGAGAHVINMSLGAFIEDGKIKEDKADLKELTKALDRAVDYAWNNGVTVIAASGNDATNFDVTKFAVSIPSQSQHVISVGATGPIGWAQGNREFARLASYSNWGKAVNDLAAPGGDFALPGNAVCTVPLTGSVTTTNFCWVFDMYLSTARGTGVNGGYSWAAGTSMASPMAAGVAALIIEKAGGSMSPALVAAELRRGALDLGKPGNDAVYGMGWVNAFGSVR